MFQDGGHFSLWFSLHSPLETSVTFPLLEFSLKFLRQRGFLGFHLTIGGQLNGEHVLIVFHGQKRAIVMFRRNHDFEGIAVFFKFLQEFLHFVS